MAKPGEGESEINMALGYAKAKSTFELTLPKSKTKQGIFNVNDLLPEIPFLYNPKKAWARGVVGPF